ncbi:uncharacterized protein LOC143898898 [Temnothorax americanus]|uniref:uncharacterized protein LOC143898898 n=1 Tax=Temnothorax americanus TaxID=1964332 RepID=UPI0040681388
MASVTRNCSTRNSQFCVAQLNANFLRSHIDLIRLHFNTCSHHIISVSETWLNADISDNLVALDGYFLVRHDREGRRGEGVACYVHNALKVKVIAVSAKVENAPEYIIVDIRLPNDEAVLYASVYRRPKGLLLHDFEDAITGVMHLYKNVIIGGDLYCNLLSNNYEAGYLRELMSSMSMTIVPSGATHHTATSDSWLDVLAVDDSNKVQAFVKSECPFIAGHDLIELTLSLRTGIDLERTVSRRSYRSIDGDQFRDDLRSIEGSSAFQMRIRAIASDQTVPEVDDLCAVVSQTLIEALDVHAPIRGIVIRRPPVRWLTEDLKTRLRERNRLYKHAKRSNSILAYATYRLFRNRLNADIKRAKSEFQFNSLIKITDSSKLWRELARLGLVKSTLVSPLQVFTSDQLNAYFASVYDAQSPCTYADFVVATAQVVRPSHRPEFDFSTVTPNDVLKLLADGPLHSYASGLDGIPMFVLRIAWSVMGPWLVELFNRSLETSVFPSQWKRALIRPLSKICISLSPSDTRPIAYLPELSKILEKIVALQIVHYLNDHNLLNPRQSAYRPGYNTQAALLRVCNDIKKGIDEGLITIMVLFDFSKAFDMVPHLRLFMKLKTLGFSDAVLAWLFSYLTGRSQAIVAETGKFSGWRSTWGGVPQGSVLCPHLFSLYVNDIGCVLRYSEHMIFADDIQIYYRCPPANICQGIELITKDANAIFVYARENGLKLNPSKSNVMIFGSNAHVSNISLDTLPPVIVNAVPLPFVTEVRNLGVIFSPNLSWRKHISLVSRKTHNALHKIKFNKNSLSTALRVKLVVTLVLPHIDYCCLVYHSLTGELNTKLQRAASDCCKTGLSTMPLTPRDEHGPRGTASPGAGGIAPPGAQSSTDALLQSILRKLEESDKKFTARFDESDRRITAFIEHQESVNADFARKLDQLPVLAKSVSDQGERIAALEAGGVHLCGSQQSGRGSSAASGVSRTSDIIISGIPGYFTEKSTDVLETRDVVAGASAALGDGPASSSVPDSHGRGAKKSIIVVLKSREIEPWFGVAMGTFKEKNLLEHLSPNCHHRLRTI